MNYRIISKVQRQNKIRKGLLLLQVQNLEITIEPTSLYHSTRTKNIKNSVITTGN